MENCEVVLGGTDDLHCDQDTTGGCTCTFSDGSGQVDLRSIGFTDNTPRFKEVKGTDDNFYSYNPCHGFTEGKCENAAVCLTKDGEQYQIGNAGESTFEYSDEAKSVFVAYVIQGEREQASIIELKCDPSACDPVLDPKGEATPGFYSFQLTSVCSCAGKCTDKGAISCQNPPNNSMFGPGSIVLIGVGSVLVLYVILGTLYMKLMKKASGTDLIPNKELWKNLISSIYRGAAFLFSNCTPKRTQYKSVD